MSTPSPARTRVALRLRGETLRHLLVQPTALVVGVKLFTKVNSCGVCQLTRPTRGTR